MGIGQKQLRILPLVSSDKKHKWGLLWKYGGAQPNSLGLSDQKATFGSRTHQVVSRGPCKVERG